MKNFIQLLLFFCFFVPGPIKAQVIRGLNANQNVCAAYTGLLKANGFTNHWRFLESSGLTAADSIGTNDLIFNGSPSWNNQGPLVIPSKAVTLSASNQNAYSSQISSNPAVFTFVVWFKTTTTSGGKIFGFGDQQTGNSSNYDRHLYMNNSGQLVFGVYSGAANVIITPTTYNDGAWHMAAASLGPTGMSLDIDGSLVMADPTTYSVPYSGYWRLGADNLGWWPSGPSSGEFTGTIAEVAVAEGLAIEVNQLREIYQIGKFCSHYVPQPKTLSFRGSAQTISKDLCSNPASVSMNGINGAVNVGLSAPGVDFFADSECTQPISSITIPSASVTSPNFYFSSSTVGAVTMTATSPTFVSATQALTISTNPFVWTGAGGNTLWGNAANWSGGSMPGASDIALFDGTCASNCSPTLGANVVVGGVRFVTGWTGTFNQSPGFTLDVGASGFFQFAGTFIGGDAAINIRGVVRIMGGSFSSTTGTFLIEPQIPGPMIKVASTATFSAASSNVVFIVDCGVGDSNFKFDQNVSFASLSVNSNAGCDVPWQHLGTGSITVTSQFGHNSGHLNFDVDLKGNFNVGGSAGTPGGHHILYSSSTGTVTMSGTGNQTYLFLSGSDRRTGNVFINKTSGTVTPDAATTDFFIERFSLLQGSFTFPVGTFGIFASSAGTVFNQAAGTSLTVGLGTFEVRGDGQPYPYITAILDFPGPAIAFHHIDIGAKYSFYTHIYQGLIIGIKSGGKVIANGNFYFASPGESPYNGLDGDWDLNGNASFGDIAFFVPRGNAAMNFVGLGNQTVQLTAGSILPGGDWTVNKPSGTLILASGIPLTGTGQNLTFLSGTMDMSSYNLDVAGTLSLPLGSTLTRSGGILTYGAVTPALGTGGTLNP